MTNLDLREAMVSLADRAPAPPPDLLDRVESGHRRRRRGQAVTAAFAAVVLVAAGGWVVGRPPAERVHPAAGFSLPVLPVDPPLLTETWRGATVAEEPPSTPDGSEPVVVGRVDQGHLLVWGRVSQPAADAVTTLWNYAVDEKTYRPVLTHLPAGARVPKVAVTSTSILRIQTDDRISRITLSPAGGGSMREFASVEAPLEATGIFADEENVYWSDWSTRVRTPHVSRFTPRYEAFEPLPDFDGLAVDGSAWARNADGTRFRNLRTGEERVVVRPAGADRLDCVPAFCLGHDAAGWFLQRTDGAERTALPYPGTPRLVGGLTATGAAPDRPSLDSGLLLLSDGVLIDPVTGRYGVATHERQCAVKTGTLNDELFYQWSVVSGGKCAGPPRTAYIGASG